MTPSRPEMAPPEAPLALVFLPWSPSASTPNTLKTVLTSIEPSLPVFLPASAVPDADAGMDADARLNPLPYQAGGRPGELLNAAADTVPQADLVVIADAVELVPGWLAQLQAAIEADEALAAVTALVINSDHVLLGHPAVEARSAQKEARTGQMPRHPRVLVPWPHCTLIRRAALQLTGPFNPAFTHPAAVLADFGARALRHGLPCAVVEDLCLNRGPDRLGPCPQNDQDLLGDEHPWLAAAASDQGRLDPGPLRRALVVAHTLNAAISVTIDARALGPSVGGTQTYISNLVLALSRSPALRMRALVSSHAPVETVEAFRDAGVELITPEAVEAGLPATDIAHRPQQAFSPGDLRLLQKLGDRLVVSQMDLILYRNPAYHASVQGWLDYRRATRLTLAIVDQTVFFSEHGRAEALAEDLVDPSRTAVAGIGVETGQSPPAGRRPAAVPENAEFLLVLGSDYTHKNRPFALALADDLRHRHGWDGYLVLAGPHQMLGSSQADERRLLSERPDLASRVIDLGPVPEVERRWLISAATAHICASSYEGFGLIPLEAAAAGRPCIYAARTSLAEVIHPDAATIVPWDVSASADRAAPLLQPGAHQDEHLARLKVALDRYSWPGIVDQLTATYRRAIASPYPGATPLVWEAIGHEEQLRDLQDRVRYGQILIDREGGLLTQPEQRGLMRVASRRWLRSSLLSPFRLLGMNAQKSE